jgi:hypothetical protein
MPSRASDVHPWKHGTATRVKLNQLDEVYNQSFIIIPLRYFGYVEVKPRGLQLTCQF